MCVCVCIYIFMYIYSVLDPETPNARVSAAPSATWYARICMDMYKSVYIYICVCMYSGQPDDVAVASG